jgi:hypothetical protein
MGYCTHTALSAWHLWPVQFSAMAHGVMVSFENGPDIEMVSNVSEFLLDTVNIWDNDSALVYCIWRRAVASWWLHYGVTEFLWIFIKHQIMSYVLNYVVEILLNLTYDLGSSDQTMKDSLFHALWVVWLQVQIMTCMSRFLIHFHGKFKTPLHDQNVQQQKVIISFNFYCEFDRR